MKICDDGIMTGDMTRGVTKVTGFGGKRPRYFGFTIFSLKSKALKYQAFDRSAPRRTERDTYFDDSEG